MYTPCSSTVINKYHGANLYICAVGETYMKTKDKTGTTQQVFYLVIFHDAPQIHYNIQFGYDRQ